MVLIDLWDWCPILTHARIPRRVVEQDRPTFAREAADRLVAGQPLRHQGPQRRDRRRPRARGGGLLRRDGHATPRPPSGGRGLYILDGEIRLRRGDDEFTAGPGEFVFGPREVPRCFKVLDGGARALVLLTPAGLEEMFVEGGVPAHEGMVPPAMGYDMQRVTALAVKYGWDVLGPPIA